MNFARAELGNQIDEIRNGGAIQKWSHQLNQVSYYTYLNLSLI